MTATIYVVLVAVMLTCWVVERVTRKKMPFASLVLNIVIAIMLCPIICFEFDVHNTLGIIIDVIIGIGAVYNAAECIMDKFGGTK